MAPVDLGSGDAWSSVPTSDPDSTVHLNTGPEGASIDVSSSGGPMAVRHMWAPVVLPVLLAGDVRLGNVPTVEVPNGTAVPIRDAVRAADAVPGQLSGVAVADLASILRSGSGTGSVAPGTQTQIWVAPAAVGRLGELTQALAAAQIRVVRTHTVDTALFAQRHTASALTGQVGPWLAALAGVFAALGIALTVAGQQTVLGSDLAALRLAGVPGDTLRRSVLLTYLGTGLLSVVIGAAAGAYGCRLVVSSLPLLPTSTFAIHNDLGLHLGAWLGCLAVAVLILGLVVLLSVRTLLRGSAAEQLRSTR